MKIHDLAQGSPEWLAYRAQHFNASDAPAMLGCSPYKTRSQLLREMHTGVAPEVDIATQKRFDSGHRAEALARPLAEEFIGQELYPVTGSNGRMSASFDGLTMDENEAFEHKALNDALRDAFRAMAGDEAKFGGDAAECRLLPIYHRVQMEQQLLVSGAERILFMASSWTADEELVEERHCWYYPDAALRQQILDGWAQFEVDLAAFVLTPKAEAITAAPVEALPAVAVRMDGALVVQSNLPAFGLALKAFVDRVPKRPSTDQEFADTEAACKALKRAEEALDAAESNALASLADVNAMRQMVGEFRDLARATRLASEKMVDRRKTEVKEDAVVAARRALDAHIADLNAEIAPMRLQPVPADFAGAIKGKRSIDSMQDALDSTLATAKITADAQARLIRANLFAFKAKAAGFEHLFADLSTLVHKPEGDFCALIDGRIATHKAAEAEKERQRAAAEAQRIAAAEQRAREQEAARIAAQQAEDARVAALAKQREQDTAAESIRVAAAAAATVNVSGPAHLAPQPAPGLQFDSRGVLVPVTPVLSDKPVSDANARAFVDRSAKPDEPATLSLGAICERLGVTVNAQFLSDTLHVKAAGLSPRKTPLFTETQFGSICRQLVSHVSAMAELYAGETV